MESRQELGRDLAIPLGGLLPIVTAMALVPLRDDMVAANVALVLMATVVIAASVGDRWAGIVGAVSATLSFDFFFTRPYLSLTIDSADDVETALVLLVTGVFVGTLAARRRRVQQGLQHRIEQGSDEIASLHRVADLVAHGAQPAEILYLCERELTTLLRLEGCDFHAGPSDGSLPRLERNGALSGGSLRYVGGEFALPAEGVDLPVYHRGQQIGSFVLDPARELGVSIEQRVVAVAIADQAGAALGPRSEIEGAAQ